MFAVRRWQGICALALAAACADDTAERQAEPSPVNADANLPSSEAGVSGDAGAALDPQPRSDAAAAGARDASLPDDAGRADADNPGRDAGRANARDASSADDASDRSVATDASSGGPADCSVKPIPDALRTSYKLGAIYKRFADADGVPVIASDKPSDESIRRACLLVVDYGSVRAEIHDALLSRKVRFIMMAKSEKTVNFPEYASLGDLDQRARGLGGVTDAICAEENVLCDRTTDRWRGESICVHEYAHTMHSGAWNVAIPNFNSRLQAAYNAAIAAGKYESTYAGEKLSEYLAEGVQDWYNTNLESAMPNGIHNFVNTRAELETYDPTLYGLLKEVLPDKPSFRDCYYYP